MKLKEEIYCVRFNKAVLRDGDIHSTTYTLGFPAHLSPLIPTSIILKDQKITVVFNDKTKHIFHYLNDVELFYREIEKTEKDGRNI